MDFLLRTEQSYRDHYDRVAAIDREGWKRVPPTPRRHRRASVRVSMAKILVALATRLAPADTPLSSIEPAPNMGD